MEIHPDMSGKTKLDGDMLSQILFENTVGTPTILMEKACLKRSTDLTIDYKVLKIGIW